MIDANVLILADIWGVTAWLAILVLGGITGAAAWVHLKKYQVWALPVLAMCGPITLILLFIKLNYFFIVILLAAAMGVAIAKQREKTTAWARPLAGLAATLIVLVTGTRMLYRLSGCAGRSIRKEAEAAVEVDEWKNWRYYDNSMVKLGQKLAEKFIAQKVLILHTDVSPEDAAFRVGSLLKGMDGKLKVLATEVVGPSHGTLMGSGEAGWALRAADIDVVVSRYPDCALVVLLEELPGDFEEMKLWSRGASLAFVVGSCRPGTVRFSDLDKHRVEGLLVSHLGEPPPSLAKYQIPGEFGTYLIWVDRSNAKQVAKSYPAAFAEEED